jgi:hypothetical protein
MSRTLSGNTVPQKDCLWGGFPFALSEAYFVQADHPGFSLTPGEGSLLVLHLPTNDLWLLTGSGDRLYVTQWVEAATANAATLKEIQSLRVAAREFVGAPQLSHPKTKTIVYREPQFQFQESPLSPSTTSATWVAKAQQ